MNRGALRWGAQDQNLKIGELEKRECLAITLPGFVEFWGRAFPPDFFEEKKLSGTLGEDPQPVNIPFQHPINGRRYATIYF
jgi:hypothetical protein